MQLVIIQTPERFNAEQTKDFWAGRVYALLDNKKSDTYGLLLEGIASETSLKNITSIFSDMENGWISACRDFFGMGVAHHLCCFHIVKGMFLKIKNLLNIFYLDVVEGVFHEGEIFQLTFYFIN
jgi:hypothetical protein